ncbi:MAG TPA: hypothetical protein VM307_11670 [Egibacteraceae bacterium]|nr:hypothetical protein [Egibacteraceae bacterium]
MSPRSRRRGGGNRSRAKNRRSQQQAAANFWGDVSALPPGRADVRITDDPAAVARSLGPPPLTGHEIIAEAYFAAVYDRAVTLAGAVATAGGLISQDELTEELED